MNKVIIYLLCITLLCICTSACNIQNHSSSLIKSQRRFAQYVEKKVNTDVIDLSEGPKLKYNADFGPKNLDFDIKIINPY